jgi:small GTP-binding protein
MEEPEFLPPQLLKAKVCLVGEFGVGKTSLIRRFVLDEFDDRYLATIGAKITKKEIHLTHRRREIGLQLTIWDIMGEKAFRDLLREAYFEGCHGFFALCDVTRSDTLFDLAGWIRSVRKVAGGVPFIVLANKIDLEERIVVTVEDVGQMARQYNAPFLMVSAKTGENVETAFQRLGEMVLAARGDGGRAG